MRNNNQKYPMQLILKSRKHGPQVVVFDDEDEKIVKSYKWSVYTSPTNNTLYAGTNKSARGGTVGMHKILFGSTLQIDHIDGNGLNNRRNNLRQASSSQNQFNRGATRRNSSGFKCVFWHKKSGKWTTHILVNGKRIYGGLFRSKYDAAKKYNDLAIAYHGEFAVLNEIPI